MPSEPPSVDEPHQTHQQALAVQHRLIAAAREQASSVPARTARPQPETQSGIAFDPSSSGPPPDSFTGYQILGELHRGGQGIVYQAIQKSTHRKVAIKVMKEGPFASVTEKARFDREVQVLGQLRHPNIVAIHGTGMAAGHHYFVMDYIHGQPLDVFIAGRRHGIDEILRLFAKIGDAVSNAHLRGIIHRDLKPSNVRIDDHGEPHILDFGLAKSAPSDTDVSVMTVTGQFVGSLPWASPEQAEGVPGKIDVRTDVYSLGVLLYQILTGRFPYDIVGSMRDVLERILHAEPHRPRALRTDINDEIETILLRCLEKEPERRYQSAGELARDIRHYLAGEPIEAKRDSTIYVLRKRLRKHWIPVSIIAAFLLTVLIGFVVSAAGWRHAASQRDAAQAAHDEADRQRDSAIESRAEAEAVTKFLTGMLTSATPYGEQGRIVSVAEVLDRASQTLDQSFPDRPLVRATIHDAIASTYESLRLYSAARVHSEASLDLRTRMLQPDDLDLAKSLLVHAAVLSDVAEYAPAEELARQALDIRRRHLGTRHPAVAECLHWIGHMLLLRGRLDEAEASLREALDQQLEFLGRENQGTASMMHFLAAVLVDKGRHEEAQRILREVIAIRTRLFGEKHPDVANSLSLLGESLTSSGNPQEALVVVQSALDIRRALFKNESAEVANSLSDLCTVMVSLERFEEAEPICRENVRVRREVYGERHPTMTIGLIGLGRLYVRWQKPLECEAPLREAVDLLGESQPEHWRLAYANSLRGACLAEQERFEEAEPLLREGLDRIRAVKGDRDRYTREALQYLTALYDARDTSSDQGDE